MRAYNKKRKRKHYSKGFYKKSIAIENYYFFRSYPLKLISTVFKDIDGLIFESWNIKKHKFKNNF